MDNHTDTHCFGSNIRPISFTLEEYTVPPFVAEYSEQVNTPMCIGATSYTMELREVIILIFGQGLWFGNRMEADFNTHIPMLMVGSTCEFLTWYPTDDEIDTC